MALERMQVTNHERWGNLVKTWSTGKNYLDDDNKYPIPTTIDEFKEQLAKAQVFMTVPDRYTQGQVRRIASWTRSWCVAAAVAIEDSEEKISQPGATYPLPPFYKRLFNGMDPVIPEAEKFKVHAERIGDYTISYLRLSGLASPYSGIYLDRKPCATQTVAQGLPSPLTLTG